MVTNAIKKVYRSNHKLCNYEVRMMKVQVYCVRMMPSYSPDLSIYKEFTMSHTQPKIVSSYGNIPYDVFYSSLEI